jgi:hypothetical protein
MGYQVNELFRKTKQQTKQQLDQYTPEELKEIKWGFVHFSLFMILIIAGIVVKRVYHHPEFMMLFHGPAAIFLVVAGLKLTAKQRRQYKNVLPFNLGQKH